MKNPSISFVSSLFSKICLVKSRFVKNILLLVSLSFVSSFCKSWFSRFVTIFMTICALYCVCRQLSIVQKKRRKYTKNSPAHITNTQCVTNCLPRVTGIFLEGESEDRDLLVRYGVEKAGYNGTAEPQALVSVHGNSLWIY